MNRFKFLLVLASTGSGHPEVSGLALKQSLLKTKNLNYKNNSGLQYVGLLGLPEQDFLRSLHSLKISFGINFSP
jgi:hypothetical protein